jgi:hypothetical protein
MCEVCGGPSVDGCVYDVAAGDSGAGYGIGWGYLLVAMMARFGSGMRACGIHARGITPKQERGLK